MAASRLNTPKSRKKAHISQRKLMCDLKDIIQRAKELRHGDDAIEPGTLEGFLDDILALEQSHQPRPEDWVCPECGNDQLQHLDWVMTNTGEVIGDNENTEYWCPNCEDHYERVESRRDFEASKKA